MGEGECRIVTGYVEVVVFSDRFLRLVRILERSSNRPDLCEYYRECRYYVKPAP